LIVEEGEEEEEEEEAVVEAAAVEAGVEAVIAEDLLTVATLVHMFMLSVHQVSTTITVSIPRQFYIKTQFQSQRQ